MNDPVLYQVADLVATITLDSPSNRNALSSRLVAGLGSALTRAAADPQVRAVVLTHTGGTFCAGADLSEASARPAQTAPPLDPSGSRDRSRPQDPSQAMVALLRQVVELPKPVIARLDGHVRAGGMGLVAACDMAVAGPRSTFALSESRIGVAPAIISLTVLPRMSSRAAGRYFLTGEKFGPGEAAATGLVTLAAEDPVAVTAGILAELRACSPQGLAASKGLTTASTLAAFDRSAQDLAELSATLFAGDDAREGMAAFLAKRPPRWAR